MQEDLKNENIKENNEQNENISNIKNNKKNIVIGAICVAIVVMITISLCLLYRFFCNKNQEAIQTISEINEESADIVVNLSEKPEESTDNIQEELEETEQLTEEEKKAAEEEQKKLEEKKKKEEEEKKKKQEEEKYNAVNGYNYYIKVNYTANTVTIYTLDSNGKYTIPVKAMVCSTGASTPKSGVYKTQNKYRWKLLIGNSQGQYSTRITGQILFHSVPYETTSEDSLITRYYDRLGITTSLGCIRLTVADAKWIYDNCPLGTKVEFYSASNPGPLGKPLAKKITDYGYPLNRWDPTDPNPNNPWKTYNNNSNVQDNTSSNNNNNNVTENDTSADNNTTGNEPVVDNNTEIGNGTVEDNGNNETETDTDTDTSGDNNNNTTEDGTLGDNGNNETDGDGTEDKDNNTTEDGMLEDTDNNETETNTTNDTSSDTTGNV